VPAFLLRPILEERGRVHIDSFQKITAIQVESLTIIEILDCLAKPGEVGGNDRGRHEEFFVASILDDPVSQGPTEEVYGTPE